MVNRIANYSTTEGEGGIMDTKRFELTPREIESEWHKAWEKQGVNADLDDEESQTLEAIAKAQVVKVLSHFEPVELEALGDEEMKGVLSKGEAGYLEDTVLRLIKAGSQATIQQNQSKGQLYRIREGKNEKKTGFNISVFPCPAHYGGRL